MCGVIKASIRWTTWFWTATWIDCFFATGKKGLIQTSAFLPLLGIWKKSLIPKIIVNFWGSCNFMDSWTWRWTANKDYLGSRKQEIIVNGTTSRFCKIGVCARGLDTWSAFFNSVPILWNTGRLSSPIIRENLFD